jgi:heme oxygenase
MLSQELKEATKINHQVLEKKLIGRIKSIRSKKDYGELLITFYAFFGGLECALKKHLDLSRLPDYPDRRKTSALEHDLKEMGIALPGLTPVTDLPAINSHFHSLGVLYVMEGSTLGGKIITKMILQQSILIEPSQLSFFIGYGDKTEYMWEAFKHSIDQPLASYEKEIIIRAANNTFVQFSEWFNHSQVRACF